MVSLYKTLVRPHVECCRPISAWNPHYIKDKELIEKVAKTINNMEGKTYEKKIALFKLWTPENRME